MGKPPKDYSVKVRRWLLQLQEVERKYFKVEGNKVICTACCKGFEFKMPSQLTQHASTELHKRAVKRSASENKTQQLMTEPVRNEFVVDMCRAFLSADIPINKISNPTLRNFIDKYTKRNVPSISTLRRSISDVYNDVIDSIRREIGERPIWLSVDETTDSTARYVANVVIGVLDKNSPSTPHLLLSRELQVTNNSTITQLILDALIFLWPGQKNEDISKKFVILLSDAAAYMLRSGKNLKEMYPNLMHVTCLAHGLNRVAETIKDLFPLANRMMASVKAIFKKAPSRVLKYKELNANLPLPPEPVQTRWGTWLVAADFYASHFEDIRQVIMSLDKSDAASIKQAQNLFEMKSLKGELACLSANFTFIAKTITSLEDRKLSLSESVAAIENVKRIIASSNSAVHKSVQSKLVSVLERNPDYKKIVNISHILNGELSDDGPDFDPDTLAAMKYCPITSVEVERSFSMEKAILTDRRHKYLMENLEKVVVCHYELSMGAEVLDLQEANE